MQLLAVIALGSVVGESDILLLAVVVAILICLVVVGRPLGDSRGVGVISKYP